ncbi:hypothetical protein vseg_008439 [Gypsophila vaccaria]
MGKVFIERKSSIETEPRTLDFRQINIAREAALYIIHTRSTEEAYQIFTKGLKTIDTKRAQKMAKATKLWENSDGEEDDELTKLCFGKPMKQETSFTSFKDIVTAPF